MDGCVRSWPSPPADIGRGVGRLCATDSLSGTPLLILCKKNKTKTKHNISQRLVLEKEAYLSIFVLTRLWKRDTEMKADKPFKRSLFELYLRQPSLMGQGVIGFVLLATLEWRLICALLLRRRGASFH